MRKLYTVAGNRAVEVPSKQCKDCGNTYPVSHFKQKRRAAPSSHGGGSAGRSPTCRNCDLRKQAQYIIKNR